MATLSDHDSVLAARKIKKMIIQSTTREQLATTQRYFKLFREKTAIPGLANDIEIQIAEKDKALFSEPRKKT